MVHTLVKGFTCPAAKAARLIQRQAVNALQHACHALWHSERLRSAMPLICLRVPIPLCETTAMLSITHLLQLPLASMEGFIHVCLHLHKTSH